MFAHLGEAPHSQFSLSNLTNFWYCVVVGVKRGQSGFKFKSMLGSVAIGGNIGTLNCRSIMLTIKRLTMCSTRGGSRGMYIMFTCTMQIGQPTLWNPKEKSPEIQNRGTSGPKIGHVNLSAKNILKNNVWFQHLYLVNSS